jgi:hypothetical protein
MPDFSLSSQERDALVAYILSLRYRHFRSTPNIRHSRTQSLLQKSAINGCEQRPVPAGPTRASESPVVA